jgi:hypothetical protein
MKTKTQIAIDFYNKGNLKKALSIFKTFKMNLTKHERDVLITAYECLSGSMSFYTQLGIDCNAIEKESKQIIENKLMKHEKI